MKKKQKKAKKPKSDPKVLDLLVREAKAVRERAYAPYSKFKVGAAIMTKRGSVFVGCNVENASYGGSICAERGAVMQMVAAGEREPIAVAVVTAGDEPAAPCGICRQILAEFNGEMPIAMASVDKKGHESGRVVSLSELLPLQFRLKA